MALKNDFFSDTLYEYLSLPVSASEEDIQKAYDVLKMRVERGFMVTEEDKVKIVQLESKLFDPEYRLRSLILKGDFGSDGLDLQLKRLKKMFAAKKIVAQEWIDVGSSLVVILRSGEFSELLLGSCALTRKAGPDEQKTLIKAVDSVFQALVDLQVSGVENAFKNFDRTTALEHLNVVEHLPGLPPELRQNAVEAILELFWKPERTKIAEIQHFEASLASEKSEYNAKVLTSRIEQEAKEGLIPTYDLFNNHNFKNQKKYLDEIRAVLEGMIHIFQERHKPEKADFFIKKLSQAAPGKNVSPSPTAFIRKVKKSSETQTMKPVPDQKTDFGRNQVPSHLMSNKSQEILQRIKILASSGRLKQAQSLLQNEIRKAQDPDVKHSLESATQDPLFLLDTNARPPQSFGFLLFKKEAQALVPGYDLGLLWFAFGKKIPIMPLKAFLFKTETEECLGRIPMPRLKRGAQTFLAPALGMGLLALAIPGYFFLSPSAQKQAEKSYQSLRMAGSPEERFSQSLDFLSQEPFRETDLYSQVLQETADLILDRLKTYESQGKLPDFMNRMGAVLDSLNKELKQVLLQKIAPPLEQHFVEKNFEPADFFLWWLKTGTYGMAQSLLSKKIELRLQNQDLKGVRQALGVARKYSIRLPSDLVHRLLDQKILPTGLALFLVSKYPDLPVDLWRTGILELWELRSPLSDDEGLLVLEKTGDQLPDLRVDLLQSALDKNKKNQIAWPDKVEPFQNPSVEKRVKLLACRYQIQHGNYEEALKLSKTLPTLPENRPLYHLRLPLFFVQGQYFRMRHFFETLHPEKDEFYECLKGLAYTRTGDWKKGARILEPVVNARFQDYLSLWKRLNAREDVVRKMVIEKLKSKKGSYYEVYRRIYLIQDDKEAAREKEKFILSEIAGDFNVKKIKAEIAENRYAHEGIFGWIEAILRQKNASLLRKTEERLLELKSVFFEPLTEVHLGHLYALQGKPDLAQTTFQNLEQSCWDSENEPPLLALCQVYQTLLLDAPLKKLAKSMLKKCKNQKTLDDLHRFLALTATGGDKTEHLNAIRDKSVVDEINTLLAEIQQAKSHPTEAPLLAQMEKILQNSGRFFNTDQSPLLETLGDQLFLLYRLNHSTNALDQALHFFRKSLLFRNGNPVLETKILHGLWFRILDRLFVTPDVHLLSDDFTLPYWHAVAAKVESGQTHSLGEALNSNPDFQESRLFFHRILSQNTLWASPPVFFDLLHTPGVEWEIPQTLNFSNMKKTTFSQFWAGDPVTQTLLENKRRLFLESGEKSGGNYAKDSSLQNADNLVKEGETALWDWTEKNTPIKGNFEKLLERLEFSKALKPSLGARKLILDVKLARLALWFDPNRDWIGALPPSWVIAKFVREGQTSRNFELQALLDESVQIQEAGKPFFLEDLCGLQAGDPAFIQTLSPKTQSLLALEADLSPSSRKNQVRIQLFGKKN